jgi:DNA-binding transcriptional LysR family regulator
LHHPDVEREADSLGRLESDLQAQVAELAVGTGKVQRESRAEVFYDGLQRPEHCACSDPCLETESVASRAQCQRQSL